MENSLCKLCNSPDSLRHRLNDCKVIINKFKDRHDYIVKELVDMIKLKSKSSPILHLDSRVLNVNGDGLTGENATKRPDIWFFQNNQYNLIEVTVPYGDINEEDDSSLDIRYQQKKDKYKQLLKDITEQTGKAAKLYVIVISSLGAWNSYSLRDLRKLAGDKDLFKRFAKRMVASVLRSSRRLLIEINKETEKDKEEVQTSEGSADNMGTEEELSEGKVFKTDKEDQYDTNDLDIIPEVDSEEGTLDNWNTNSTMSHQVSSLPSGDDTSSEEEPSTL